MLIFQDENTVLVTKRSKNNGSNPKEATFKKKKKIVETMFFTERLQHVLTALNILHHYATFSSCTQVKSDSCLKLKAQSVFLTSKRHTM